MQSFDLMVIGSGSGLEVSAEAANRGLSVAVVEHGPFGGTCLNRGCIPSKMLIHSADVMETIRRAELFGITAQVSTVDWDSIVNRVVSTIDPDAQAIEEANRQHPNITVFKDTGRFVGHKVLEAGHRRRRLRHRRAGPLLRRAGNRGDHRPPRAAAAPAGG